MWLDQSSTAEMSRFPNVLETIWKVPAKPTAFHNLPTNDWFGINDNVSLTTVYDPDLPLLGDFPMQVKQES